MTDSQPFTCAEEARALILSGAAPPGMLIDELIFRKEDTLIRMPPGMRIGKLTIENCPNLSCLPEQLDAEEVVIRECRGLSAIPSSAWVANLIIQSCWNLTELPEGLELGDVTILDCPHLNCLPRRFSFISLRMPGSRLSSLSPKCSRAAILDVRDSHRLTCIPSLSVRDIVLRNCTALSKLPEEIEADLLDLSGCTGLRWPDFALIEVRTLDLSNCTQIDHLPDWLTVHHSIDVANTGIKGFPPWLRHCAILWRGVAIDERVAFRPETISRTDILEEENSERRRVMIERMGLEKFLDGLTSEVIHQDRDPGGERQLLSFRFRRYDTIRVLSACCPSTGRRYIIPVPPWVAKCNDAAAWIAGFDDPRHYNPIAET